MRILQIIVVLNSIAIGTIEAMQPPDQLWHAIQNGDKETVKRFPVNIHTCGSHSMYPIHVAAKYGQYEIMDHLITEQNAHVESKTNKKTRPLHIAAQHGHLNTVRYLIDEQNASPYKRDDEQETLLHKAALNGHKDIVQYCIEEKGMSINEFADYGSPLHYATTFGHYEVAKWLVKNGASLFTRDKFQRTPLHSAAQCGHDNIVRYLLEQQDVYLSEAERNQILYANDWIQRKPLHLAALTGKENIVTYLIKQQYKDVKTPSQLGPPLRGATLNGHDKIVKHLIEEHNACPHAPNQEGNTPLHVAADWGRKNVVQYLAENCRVPIDEHSNRGTPLGLAIENRHWDIVRYLVEKHNADIWKSIPLDFSYRMLIRHAAIKAAPHGIISFLLQHGGNINDVLEKNRNESPLNNNRIHTSVKKLIRKVTEIQKDAYVVADAPENTIREYVKIMLGQPDPKKVKELIEIANTSGIQGIALLHAYKLSQKPRPPNIIQDMDEVINMYWDNAEARSTAFLYALVDQVDGEDTPAAEYMRTQAHVTTENVLNALQAEIRQDNIPSRSFLYIIEKYADALATRCKDHNQCKDILCDIAKSPRAARCLPTFIYHCLRDYTSRVTEWELAGITPFLSDKAAQEVHYVIHELRQDRDENTLHSTQSIHNPPKRQKRSSGPILKATPTPVSEAESKKNTPYLAYHALMCSLFDIKNKKRIPPQLLPNVTQFAQPKYCAIGINKWM